MIDRLIRKKAGMLGYVTAPDRDAAEARAAVEMFQLTPEQRKRLIVTEYR